MTIWLKQSTAVDVVLGPFVDSTDGATAETGLTISQADCQLTKNGGAVAQKNDSTAASHLGGGHYKVPLNTTDTNTLGRLRLYVNEGGALPAWMDFMVVPANVWDSFFGADYLQVDATQLLGTAIAPPATAGLMDVNVKQISTDATAADNLELMYDGTGYAGGTTKLGVNVVQISSDTTAADNAESFFDGTGYAGTNNVIPTVTAAGLSAAAVDAVWDEALSGHTTAGSAGKALSDAAAAAAPSAAAIADAIWDEALSGHTTAGSAGKALSDAQDGDYIAGNAAAATTMKRAYDGIIYGAAATGTLSATQATTDLTGYANDALIGRTLTVTSGSRIGQQTIITDYASSGGLLTFTALTGALANGDQFFIA